MKNSTKLLITGATGFVASGLMDYIARLENSADYKLVKAVRNAPAQDCGENEEDEENERAQHKTVSIGNIDAQTNWQQALQGVDTIIHLAARVHIMRESAADPLQEFRKANVDATINLAQQAIKAGVKRFIYLSTIKVNGEKTTTTPFTADDAINPIDPYGISKSEAESALLQLHQQQLLEVVIIRPPLVYGPGVKGNFARLIGLVKKQWPLPLAGINNKRSLVSIDNLSSLIVCCISHKKAAGEVFLVSDGFDLSTSELLEELALAMNGKKCLFKLPAPLFKFLAILAGRKAEYQRLFDSLQVDINKNKQLLGWQPEADLRESFKSYFL